MIEVEMSKTGLPVIKNDGKFLCSSYDPMAEAHLWIESVSAKLNDYEFIYVLGFGSPYHVLALKKHFSKKKIVVIERNLQLVGKVKELYRELSDTVVCQLSEPRQLIDRLGGPAFVDEIFCTVRLPSTRYADRQFFDDVEIALTGRASYEFQKICELRPKIKDQIDLDKMGSGDLISIKDIASAFTPTTKKLTQELRVIRILEELVR